MDAIEFTDDHVARLVDIGRPKLQRGQAVVRITSAGICGSDLTALSGRHPFRIPPLVSGHEGGGIITTIDAPDSTLQPGDRVAIEPQRSCEHCDECASGFGHLCTQKIMLGMAEWPGTLAEEVLVPVNKLYRVDDRVSEDRLALIEPLAVAMHAVAQAEVSARTSVAVLGGGAIGSLIVRAVRDVAKAVVATDIRQGNLELCTALGATATLNSGQTGWREDLLDQFGQFDVVFVAATAPTIVDDAVALTRTRGTIVQVGLFGAPITFDIAALQRFEKRLIGSNVYTATDFEAAVDLLQRDPESIASIVSATVSLNEAVDYLNRRMAGEADQTIKLLVTPDPSHTHAHSNLLNVEGAI